MNTPNQSLTERLFRLHHAEMVNFAYRLTGDKEEAQELVQEAFVAAWKHQEHLDENNNPKAYLRKIILNLFRNKLVKPKLPTTGFEDLSVNGNHIENGNHCDLDDLQQMIDYEISQLPPRCKAVFQLSRLEELSYKEISERLGISVKTVEHQISHALKRLWEAFLQFEDGNGRFPTCF